MKKTRRWLALILAIVLVAVSGFYQLGTSLQASVDQSTVETAGGDGENQILEGNVDAGNNQDTNNQDSDSNEESKGDGQIDVQEISGDSESNDANEDSNQSEEDTDAQNDENSIQQVSEGLGTSLTANEDGSVSGSGYDSIILEINTNGITNQNNTSFNITFDTGNTDNNNKIKASNLNPNGGVASNLKKNNAGTFTVEGFDKNAFTITVSVGTGSKNSVRTAASVDQSEGKVVLIISDYYESSYTGGTFTCPSATSLGSVNNFAVFANNYKNHVDMEGNIAVKNMLLANTNGGNTEKVQENDFNLNYVENFVLDSMKAEFFRLADPLIVGNDYEITTQDSNFYLTLSSGAKINLGPSNKMKDVVNIKNSSYKIDFAAAMEGLKAYANNLYGKSDTAGLVFKDSNGDVTTASGNVQTIECKADVNNIINIKASDLQKWAGTVQLNNLGNSGSLVFNIEYDQEKEFTKPHFKINNSETGGYVADGGRILLNFGDQTGALSFGELYSGTILAPNATVYIKTTHNGSVFADTVENVSGEIHKNPWKPGDDDENQSVSVSFKGSKTLDGEPAEANKFSFILQETDADGNLVTGGYQETVENTDNGVVAFNAITYNAPGTYYYQITEVEGNDSNINYDTSVYKVTVTVDADMKAAVAYTKNGQAVDPNTGAIFSFANSSKEIIKTSVNLEGSKTLDGKAVTKAGEYKFDIIEVNASGEALEGASTETVSNDKDGNFKFPAYTYEDAGVHYYKITENVSDQKDDIKYDTSSYIVTVTVTKTTDKDGKISLQAKKTITKTDANGTVAETDKITFNNQTVSTKETDIQLTASKNLAGEPSTKSFDFELVECDADGKAVEGAKTFSASNDKNGYIQFEKITYKEAGTHYYKIKEVIPEDPEENITYDTSSYIVKVEVTKDKTGGQLIAVASAYQKLVTGEDGETTKKPVESLVFNNEMTASTSFEGEKYVDGELAAETEAGKYSFTLTRTDESFAEALTGEDAYSETVFNDEAGKITFKEIIYKAPGQYYYTISENEPEDPDPNMYYDEAVYRAKVTVSQDGTVEVEKSVVPYEGYEEDNGVESEPVEDDEILMFNNYGFMLMSMNYGMANITGTKTLIGGHLEAGEFRFGLYDEDGDLIDTTTNNASGAIEFRTLSYFNEGEYHYTVKEIQEEEGKNAGNISYDTSVYDVTVEVNEHMDTTVSYTKDGIAVDAITFENKMAVTAAVIDPGVTKELNNAKLQPGEFTFQLFDENNNLVDTKKNTDSGSVLFDSVIFDKEGEYHYTIKELIPEDKGQIIYDGREIGVAVKVTKNEEAGALEATVTYTEDGKETTDPTFVNTYHPISICVQKTSKDGSRDPLQGATYALYRVLGFGGRSLLVETQLSDASGYMTFDDIEPGIYYFKEVSAPAGHTVDEYATKKFVVSDDGSITSYVETNNNSDLLAQANQEDQKDTSTAEAQLFADVEPLATAANTSSLSFENIEDLATAANTDTEGLARASAGSSAEETSADSTILAEEIAEAPGVSDEVTKLYVSKLDATNHEFVSGAKLQIIEKETGKVVEEWTTGESAEGFERKLNVETPYILHEVSAPEGYELAEDTEFIIDAYGILSITSGSDAEKTSDTSLSLYDKKLGVTKTTVKRTEKHNTKYVDKTIAGADTTTTAKTETVKTGDTARIALFAISALAAAVIAVVVIRKRKDS